MKRVFEIEFPDDCGPFWMNKDNLLLCLNAYCENIEFKVEDVTDKCDSAASEAIYAFAGFLTSRDERVVISASNDAAPIAELVDEFCKMNDLTAPRECWRGRDKE